MQRNGYPTQRYDSSIVRYLGSYQRVAVFEAPRASQAWPKVQEAGRPWLGKPSGSSPRLAGARCAVNGFDERQTAAGFVAVAERRAVLLDGPEEIFD